MTADDAVSLFGSAIGVGLLVGLFVALTNSWLP